MQYFFWFKNNERFRMIKRVLSQILNHRYFNRSMLIVLAVMIFGLLSSFVIQIIVPSRIDPTIDEGIGKRSVEEVIQLNILNGCGVENLASEAMSYMRSFGFDVVETGNYDMQAEHSFIIDRVGDRSSAEKVAFAMGIDDSYIRTEIDSNLFLRCTVVLGKDYTGLKAFEK